MASEPSNGDEVIVREKPQIIKVYTRRGKGQRKQTPLFAQTLASDSLVVAITAEEPSDKVIDIPLVETAEPLDNVIIGEKPVVVDENSIKEPSESVTREDVITTTTTTEIVDKNLIEVPVLSVEDVNAIVVDKNPIEVSHLTKEAHPERDEQHATDDGSTPMEEDKTNPPPQTKEQKEEKRKKLEDQLNLIRGLVKKVEDKESEIGAYNNGEGRILSGFNTPGLPREVARAPRPLNQLSVSVLENSQGFSDHIEKEKRTPKANQFYRTSEFLLGDKLPPSETNKKSKSTAKKQQGGGEFASSTKVYKHSLSLLDRLMKHKHGWVFNTPVDPKALGLLDYFTIIVHPMDLGTVKSRLTNHLYKLPREFAEDVRLTFHNAMTYNPQGQDVHVMAEQLLQMFEERWAVIEADYNREMRFARLGPTMPPPPIKVDRADWSSPRQPSRTPTSTRTPALKKPKANEPNKRDMTYEEKQKLSGHLQNLPPDKLDAIVQIVNKRNTAVKLRDEEIEVDIDSVDPETLWELDRFVTNYKKGLSKKKRRAELALQARAEAEKNSQQLQGQAPVANEFSREAGATAKKTLPTQVSTQGEKQNNEASRSSSSSSSSSGSSSSSDSDSDSSSSSESDRT